MKINIDRNKPFSLVIPGGYTVIRQDERSLTLNEVDFDAVFFENFEGESEGIDSRVSLRSKLAYLTDSGSVLLDALIGQSLFLEPDQVCLEWLRTSRRVVTFNLPGTEISNGITTLMLQLFYNEDEKQWHYYWQGDFFLAATPSAVIPSST